MEQTQKSHGVSVVETGLPLSRSSSRWKLEKNGMHDLILLLGLPDNNSEQKEQTYHSNTFLILASTSPSQLREHNWTSVESISTSEKLFYSDTRCL